MEILSIDKSAEMLAFCNSRDTNAKYRKKIIELDRPFLNVEYELMKELVQQEKNESDYEYLYAPENNKFLELGL